MRTVLVLSAVLSAAGCRCQGNVMAVKPSLTVAPTSIDFGQVKNGDRQARTVTFESRTQTAVTISSIVLEPGTAVGGIEGFVLGTKPTSVDAFGKVTMPVTFAPTQLVQYQATLPCPPAEPPKPSQTSRMRRPAFMRRSEQRSDRYSWLR